MYEPLSTSRKSPSSIIVWMALVAYLLIAKVILDLFLPNAFADPAQASLFSWPALGIIALVGLVGAWLSGRTGFPDAWSASVPKQKQILYPLALGLTFGAIQMSIDLATGFSKSIAARHEVGQQYTDFPSMFFIFTAASIIVEVVYRLFIIPLLMWLISSLALKGRGQAQTFWVLAVLTSLVEPLSQMADLQILSAPLTATLATFAFGINFAQAAFYRKYGFLSSILVRVGFYLIWHVFYVH